MVQAITLIKYVVQLLIRLYATVSGHHVLSFCLDSLTLSTDRTAATYLIVEVVLDTVLICLLRKPATVDTSTRAACLNGARILATVIALNCHLLITE